MRYEYLLRDFNPSLPPNGYDDDGYDPQADSIIVIDTEINKIVGTYRIETLKTVNGRKFKDEREFNIDALKNCGYEILELGRAVVDTKYRNGVVIQLLWSGIWKYAIENNCRYIFGTCSLHGSDPSIYANLLCYLKKELLTDIDVYAIKSPFNYDYIDEYDIEKLPENYEKFINKYRFPIIDYAYPNRLILSIIKKQNDDLHEHYLG